jgi:hypothetical protein
MSEKSKELKQEAATKAKRMHEEVMQKADLIDEKIAGLEREKLATQNGCVSKAEAVQRMKADLKMGFDTFIMEKFVEPNLRTYQSGHFRPLHNFDHLKVHQLAGAEWLFFIFAWVTEAMVDQASKKLEEGPTEAERRKKIEEIDREIAKAEKELEALLK